MRTLLPLLLLAVLAGCASQAYDPLPPPGRALYERTLDSAFDVEGSYRLLYSRLSECAGAGYHVQPRFERASGYAWVMLVQGLGLDRYSFLGNRFGARFLIEPTAQGSVVHVTWVDRGLEPMVEAAARWLAGGAAGCRG